MRSMRPRVLLVEDEKAVAEPIVYALTTDGCDVRWVMTGAEGLAALGEGGVSLVLLDVGLPDANGFDVCREIRRRHDVPVVFLTARGEEMDRVVGLEIGADDYVTKPFSPRELSARVRAILRRVATPRPPTTAGSAAVVPLAIDAERRAISYFGRALDLTRTEYEILAVLVRHPGRVYSRDQLLQTVWEDPGASTDRTVDSHVKSLRAKLRAVRPELEAIVTHRGAGYALCEDWPAAP
jgi:two-component system catabolic regulation response regulator CreB